VKLGALLLVCACSAPVTLNELKTAELRADAGDTEGALVAYREAQTKCRRVKPALRAKAACSDANLGEAETLDKAGRTKEAIATYLEIPSRLANDPSTSAIAVYRAGDLLLRNKDTTAAWTQLWRVITEWPDEGPASDALKLLLADGRGRDARALADQMAKLLGALAETEVADNLLWSLADLNEHELASPSNARALYDRIPTDHPKSGLRDDARWHAARLSRAIGDPKGAAQRLRALLATREVAVGAGSYFSIWLDDAQLELGKVLRDDLKDYAGAAAAFRQLPKHYPASILKDDALYELAVTLDKSGDKPGACKVLAQLAKDAPDSKYIERGKEVCP
jgi:tetratricopeptide (TPR) repeat protein